MGSVQGRPWPDIRYEVTFMASAATSARHAARASRGVSQFSGHVAHDRALNSKTTPTAVALHATTAPDCAERGSTTSRSNVTYQPFGVPCVPCWSISGTWALNHGFRSLLTPETNHSY